MTDEYKIDKFLVREDQNVDLEKYDPKFTGEFTSKLDIKPLLKLNLKKLRVLQEKLYAQDRYSFLIILQGMDGSGKDGIIKNVMSGVNPQGCQVFSFKQPSAEELDHNYLWRIQKSLPERGRIGIFNRSHYEEVLVVRVHDLIKHQKIPPELIDEKIWLKRFKQINDFERYLAENGTIILKFFLYVSFEEQRERFLSRINNESKNWKVSLEDIEERKYWNDYINAYEDALSYTSKPHAPWYIVPSDNKWFARFLVSEIINQTLEKYNLAFPVISENDKNKLERLKAELEAERGS